MVVVTGDALAQFAAPVGRVDKPWGYELHWALSDAYCGKVLFVKSGEALSLQYHELKDETIYVHQGRAKIEMGRQGEELAVEEVGPGRSFRVMPGTVHRMYALEDTLFLEVSTPHLDDVVRLEDRYGREGTSAA